MFIIFTLHAYSNFTLSPTICNRIIQGLVCLLFLASSI